MRTGDRYAFALQSSNLKPNPITELTGHVEIIHAAGVTGQRNTLAALLHRLRANRTRSRAAIAEARASLLVVAGNLAVLRRWSLTETAIARVADETLRLFLDPICHVCEGRKYQPIIGTPTLSANPCTECRGTGRGGLRLTGVAFDAGRDLESEVARKLDAFERHMGRALK